MNQIYKKNEYVIIPVNEDFLVVNINKPFKKGHTHVHELKIAKLLISLAIKKELPKNKEFVHRLIRISEDKEYIDKLKEHREDKYLTDKDFEKMMQHNSYRKVRGVTKQR